MKTSFTEKDQNSASRANNDFTNGASMPAVSVSAQPATQLKTDPVQKVGGGEEEEPLQMKPFQLKAEPVQKAGGEEEEPLQMKPFQLKTDPVQKVGGPEEELPVQGKFVAQRVGGPEEEELQM